MRDDAAGAVQHRVVRVDRDALAGAAGQGGAWQHLPEVARARRRTLGTLLVAQVAGSLGIGAAPAVGILLAEAVTRSETWSGIARASTTIGAAFFSLALGALAARRGRRTSLTLAWAVAAVGAALLVASPIAGSIPLLVLGMLAMGAGTAGGLQSRFAATDLALPEHRGRSLALVVWVGTLGAVVGPNLGVPGLAVERALGLPPLSGAFAIGAVLLALTATLLLVMLRPDPLRMAQRLGARDGAASAPAPAPAPAPVAADRTLGTVAGTRAALRMLRASADGRFAFVALVLAHVSMVSVMTMTPVHLNRHGGTVTLIGLTISAHVVGMFGFAPIVGAAADRFGRVPVVVVGQLVLASSAAVSIVGAGSHAAVAVALGLLGLGWSVVTVPASTLLTESVPASSRPLVQGAGDASMNAAAALGAIASGPLMATVGFPGLALAAGAVVVPVLWMAARRGAARTR
ncbi:MFS transporter [Cellulomonas fimi]|uniref:MFS transporter n=1 Tax=Cellulomonas fimi TaxID=1708 RepID=A0A7Y0LZX7_CELFI|nr:MFS transporter [Cellulomonas fimi]NMR20945.1 MFS transporter [Cellulomonas fimi]